VLRFGQGITKRGIWKERLQQVCFFSADSLPDSMDFAAFSNSCQKNLC